MPSTFRKAILVPDTYVSPDGKVNVTTDRLKHWAKSFGAMKEAGLTIPIAWDHASEMDKLIPLSSQEYKKQRSAKNTIGKLADIALNEDGTGATITLEVTDPIAQGRAERNEVFVSPVILPEWKDGKGTDWQDVITHVDFVNHPVDHSQGPFAKVEAGAIACALRMGLSTQVYRMADDNPFGGDEEEEETPKPKTDDSPEPEGDKGGKPSLSSVLNALKAMVAMLDQFSSEQQDDSDDEDDLNDLAPQEGNSDPITVSDPGYLAMSQTPSKPKQAATPERSSDPAMVKLSAQANAAFAFAQNAHREKVGARLESLLANGQCSPKEYHDRKGALTAICLSLDDGGKPVPGDLEKWIDAREGVPAGTFFDPNQRTVRLSISEPPASLTGEMSADEQNKTIDFALGRKAKC